MTSAELREMLSQFPKAPLALNPTPLHPLDRMQAELDCGPLFIKRDAVACIGIFTRLDSMAVICQNDRAVDIVRFQRRDVGFDRVIYVDRRLIHSAFTRLVRLVQFAPVFRCAFSLIVPV